MVVDRQRLAACGFWDQEVGSIVEIPLVGIGSLGVSCTQEKALDGAAVTALETFAGWLTTALQRLQYLQRLGDTAEELRRDIACEQAMARVRDQILELSALPDLWTYLQEHWTPALRRLGLSVYQISLEEPAARAGYYVRGWARYAVPGTAPQAEALLTTCPWVGEAWERGEPVLVSIERLRPCAFPEEAVQSLVQLPLPGGGAIGISSTVPDAFDAAAVRILQGFAGLVSIARQRLLDLEAIRASRELLAATEQLAGIGGWAWEVSSQTMAWTDQTYRIHGMAPGDLPAGSPEHIARSLACYDAADRPVIEAAYRRCLAEGEPYELEVPFTTVDGRRLWVAIRGRAVMGEGGVARVVGHITDITDRRRMLRELADQRIRAAQVDRLQALGEMATGIAHELNQPLNGIRAFAEGLQIGVDRDWQVSPSELKKTMGEIVAQVDRITEIIDHMRAFARPEPDGEGRAFSVTEPIEGALKLMRAQLRVHGVAIQEEVAADLPAVSGRPHAIEQVILNLLSNARDALDERAGRQRGEEPGATPGWRPAVMIRAYAGADGSSVRVEVADNGDGIPPDAVDRLFEPFFTTKEVGKGTGIGLPIARGIVASHRGQIEVDNRPGDGATFVIVLPAAAS